MGGTKWNKGGTSKGTYGPVGWDLLPFRFCLQWAPEGLNMAKPLPPCLETPPATPRNPCS